MKSINQLKIFIVIILLLVVIGLSINSFLHPNLNIGTQVTLIALFASVIGTLFALVRKPLLSGMVFLLGFILILLVI